jgi:sodium/bile acid cotransporter 7
MSEVIKKYWFPLGLLLVVIITFADVSGRTAAAGTWLKQHHGPDTTIFVIFFTSGLILNWVQIRDGLMDVKGILLALVLIFLVAPLLAWLTGRLPLPAGIVIGLFLVAVMPTTLSSGVVMSGAAGGNIAHALVITIVANVLAVFTIPLSLTLLLQQTVESGGIAIDRASLMLKLGALVLVPLLLGLAGKALLVRRPGRTSLQPLESGLQKLNQVLILFIVWMALSRSRDAILLSGADLGIVVLLSVGFHGALLATAGLLVWRFKIGRGRRESVIFMGAQKTLPLSILLQVSLFPQYPDALTVCVVHHLLHLMMDGALVHRLRR